MKFSEQQQAVPRFIRSRELIQRPEAERVTLPELESLLTPDLRARLEAGLLGRIRQAARGDTSNTFAFTDLSWDLKCVAVLDQVFMKPLLSSEAKTQALETLFSVGELFHFDKDVLNQPKFHHRVLWHMASLIQFDPTWRNKLGVNEVSVDRVLERFPKWQDQLPIEEKAWVLAQLAIICPARQTACEQVLRSIGDDGKTPDHGQHLWENRKPHLKKLTTSWLEGLAGVRLLEEERELDTEDKELIIRGLDRRLQARAFSTGADVHAFAESAILFAPRVMIDSKGRIIISAKDQPIHTVSKLPDRPLI